MKKIVFAAAMIAATAAVADVTSANTVGYNTITVNSGTMVGMAVQFNDISATRTIAVTNLLTVATPATATSAGSTADEIWLWDNANTTWVKYFYYKPARGSVVGWCKEGQTTATTDTLNNGDGFFFKRAAANATTMVSLAGAVNTVDPSIPYSIASGTMTYVSYPWPMAIAVKDALTVAAPATATSAGSTADEIWMWDPANTAWVKYFYYKPARGSVVGWCKEGQTTETADTISVGQGFFFKRAAANAATTITFNKPAGL